MPDVMQPDILQPCCFADDTPRSSQVVSSEGSVVGVRAHRASQAGDVSSFVMQELHGLWRKRDGLRSGLGGRKPEFSLLPIDKFPS